MTRLVVFCHRFPIFRVEAGRAGRTLVANHARVLAQRFRCTLLRLSVACQRAWSESLERFVIASLRPRRLDAMAARSDHLFPPHSDGFQAAKASLHGRHVFNNLGEIPKPPSQCEEPYGGCNSEPAERRLSHHLFLYFLCFLFFVSWSLNAIEWLRCDWSQSAPFIASAV